MARTEDRQRVAQCGCHYDARTGLITNYCDKLFDGCQFAGERLNIARLVLAAPMVGHLLKATVSCE